MAALPVPGLAHAALFPPSPGIYITQAESRLFRNWLALPHPEIQAEYDLSALRYHDRLIPGFTLNLKDEVMATITPEQEKRFALRYVELAIYPQLDPAEVSILEERLSRDEGALLVEKEDQLADFNKAEKEDQIFRDQKLKDQQQKMDNA